MPKGIDTATEITPELSFQLVNGGYQWVARYLDDSFGRSAKSTKLGELVILKQAQLGYIPIFETTGASGVGDTPAGADYLTSDQGMYDAQHAAADLADLKYPDGLTVFFAVDRDLSKIELGSLRGYTMGIHDVLSGRWQIGLYGPWDALDYVHIYCPWVRSYWQAYAPLWSEGRNANRYPFADIQQVRNSIIIAGIEVDENESTAWDGWKGSEVVTDDELWAALQRLYPGKIEELVKPTVRVMVEQDPETQIAIDKIVASKLNA